MGLGRKWTWRKAAVTLLILFVAVPVTLTALFRFVNPPITPLMLIRLAEGYGLHRTWVPLAQISPALRRSVIAAEDGKFCRHHGFDIDAIDNAISRYEDGGPVLGASTISMQVARNVFLWPARTFLRKGLEAYLTVIEEALWPKRRILEVYLNVAELGPGLYGAEAASQHYFGKQASQVTAREAALLAALLPAPLHRSASRPSAYVQRYADIIRARAEQVELGPDGACPRQ